MSKHTRFEDELEVSPKKGKDADDYSESGNPGQEAEINLDEVSNFKLILIVKFHK